MDATGLRPRPTTPRCERLTALRLLEPRQVADALGHVAEPTIEVLADRAGDHRRGDRGAVVGQAGHDVVDRAGADALARRYEFTGGSVRNCTVRAAFLAAAEALPLSQEHLRRAIRLEYRSAGKLAEGGPLE